VEAEFQKKGRHVPLGTCKVYYTNRKGKVRSNDGEKGIALLKRKENSYYYYQKEGLRKESHPLKG